MWAIDTTNVLVSLREGNCAVGGLRPQLEQNGCCNYSTDS